MNSNILPQFCPFSASVAADYLTVIENKRCPALLAALLQHFKTNPQLVERFPFLRHASDETLCPRVPFKKVFFFNLSYCFLIYGGADQGLLSARGSHSFNQQKEQRNLFFYYICTSSTHSFIIFCFLK